MWDRKRRTGSEGLRESAEESLGRERMRLQREFHALLTQAAEANGTAGSLARMFWRRSSFSILKLVFASLEAFTFVLDFRDDDGFSMLFNTIYVNIAESTEKKMAKHFLHGPQIGPWNFTEILRGIFLIPPHSSYRTSPFFHYICPHAKNI